MLHVALQMSRVDLANIFFVPPTPATSHLLDGCTFQFSTLSLRNLDGMESKKIGVNEFLLLSTQYNHVFSSALTSALIDVHDHCGAFPWGAP
jgi:hypothetical protein